MVWPFHSYIPRVLVGGRLEAGQGPGSLGPSHRLIQARGVSPSQRCHGMALFIILANHIFILNW